MSAMRVEAEVTTEDGTCGRWLVATLTEPVAGATQARDLDGLEARVRELVALLLDLPVDVEADIDVCLDASSATG